MLKTRFGVVLFVGLLLFAIGAKADTFDLTATNGSNTVISLNLTGTVTATPGVYDITGISGTVDFDGVTSNVVNILPTTAGATYSTSTAVDGWEILYDNLLNVNAPYVDYYGLGFSLSDGLLGNIYYDNGYLYAQLDGAPPSQVPLTVSVVQTPEPSSLALLVAGMVALMLLVIRRGRA